MDLNLSVLYVSVYLPLEWKKQCPLFMFIVKTCDAEQNVPSRHLSASASSESFSVQVFPVTHCRVGLIAQPESLPVHHVLTQRDLLSLLILPNAYPFASIRLYPTLVSAVLICVPGSIFSS